MRRTIMSVVVLLTVWFLVADSASAGWRRQARRCCHESCCVSTCCNSCNSCCERTSCCQPAPCCQPGVSHQTHDQTHQKPVIAPELPKAPPPNVNK